MLSLTLVSNIKFVSSVNVHFLYDGHPLFPLFPSQDVDTIYLTQDTRELNLQDFSHLENR